MLVTPRDTLIIQTVARFKMLNSAIIRELVFPDLLSNTSCDRALLRLVQRKYIARVERRLIGGNGAGSGQYIYRLGTLGRKLVQSPNTFGRMADIHHTLEIAETFAKVKRLERGGSIEVLSYETEPESWAQIGGVVLRPDLQLEIGVIHRRQQLSLFVEIDLATERKKQLTEKIESYASAWLGADKTKLDVFPVVVFLVPDDARLRELNNIIASQVESVRDLFLVSKSEDFPQFLFD